MIRCSSLPLLVLCPASGAPCAVSVDSHDPTATSGTDIHRAIAMTLQGEKYPGNLSAADEEAVELGVAWVNNWLKPQYPGAIWRHESHIQHPPLSGTMDLSGHARHAVIVTDFKSTFRDDDHMPQLMGYAWLAFQEWSVPKVTLIIPMIRIGKAAQPVEISREFAESWMDELQRNVLDHPENYRPGEHCTRCRRRLECPALKQIVRATSEHLAAPNFEKTLSRVTLPEMRVRVKLIKEAIALFEGWQKETILENGPIDLGNGKELQAVEEKHDSINLQWAWETLQANFSDEEIAGFTKITKTGMLDALAKKTPRGGKTKAGEALMEVLKAANAVETKTITKIKEINRE